MNDRNVYLPKEGDLAVSPSSVWIRHEGQWLEYKPLSELTKLQKQMAETAQLLRDAANLLQAQQDELARIHASQVDTDKCPDCGKWKTIIPNCHCHLARGDN